MRKFSVLIFFFLASIAVAQERVDPGPTNHVIGGEDVTENEFPFVAKIVYHRSFVGCTGALIGPRTVLTAGHCVRGRPNEEISVGFGSRRSLSKLYSVKVLVHPDMHPRSQDHDIAILRLEEEAPIRTVRVLTLEEELRYAPSGSRNGVIVGWGKTTPKGGGQSPETLQKLDDIPIYTHEDCRDVIEDLRSQGKAPGPPRIHELVLCAGEEGRAGGAGDSGGPLLVSIPGGWGLVGVLSQATHDDFKNIVYMGQWTRTSYLLDWIAYPRSLIFAHSAAGVGWRTDLVLINMNRLETEATISIFRSDGPLRIENTLSIPGESFKEWVLPIGEEEVETGGVVVSSLDELNGFLRFRHESGATTSVQASPVSDAFAVPVSQQVERTGLAVYNADDKDLNVVLRMRDRALYKTIPAQGKIAAFVDEYFPGAVKDDDILFVETDPPGRITVLALEMLNGNLMTLPAVPLTQ